MPFRTQLLLTIAALAVFLCGVSILFFPWVLQGVLQFGFPAGCGWLLAQAPARANWRSFRALKGEIHRLQALIIDQQQLTMKLLRSPSIEQQSNAVVEFCPDPCPSSYRIRVGDRWIKAGGNNQIDWTHYPAEASVGMSFDDCLGLARRLWLEGDRELKVVLEAVDAVSQSQVPTVEEECGE